MAHSGSPRRREPGNLHAVTGYDGDMPPAPPSPQRPPPRRRGEPGFVTSRALIGTSFVAGLGVAVADGIAPAIEGSTALGHVVAFGITWAVLLLVLELAARHLHLVRKGTRQPAWRTGAGLAGQGWHTVAAGYASLRRPGEDPDAEPVENVWTAPGTAPAVPPGKDDPMAHSHRRTDAGPLSPDPPPVAAGPRIVRVPVTRGGPVPPEWASLAAAIESQTFGTDTELLAWIAGQIRGAGTLATAFVSVYENSVGAAGLTPRAIGSIHKAGESAAAMAETLAQVWGEFVGYYGEYREWAGAGGQTPRDPGFITGEDPN